MGKLRYLILALIVIAWSLVCTSVYIGACFLIFRLGEGR